MHNREYHLAIGSRLETSEIRLLRVFLVLMSERSVSRASHRLGLSQPATSHLLARLRQVLQDPVLIRSRQGMVPTERASEIEAQAREIIDAYDRLTAPAKRFDAASSRRTFIISAPEYAERLLLSPLLRHLRAVAPNIYLAVRAPDPERAYEQLERGEIDLRIAWLPSPSKSLRSVQLFQDRLVCIADKKHPKIGHGLSLDEFLSSPHLRTSSYSRTTIGRVIDEAVGHHSGAPVRTFVVQNFEVIPSAILGTDLIATLPRRLALEYSTTHALRIFDVPMRLPLVRYAAYWHERHHREPGHKWLRATLSTLAESHLQPESLR